MGARKDVELGNADAKEVIWHALWTASAKMTAVMLTDPRLRWISAVNILNNCPTQVCHFSLYDRYNEKWQLINGEIK